MSKLPKSLDDLNYNKIEVERAELRNGKIIIVIKPRILSDQIFAVNPFYDEGKKKNQLGEVYFNLEIKEAGGTVKVDANFGNGLSHFTKGHTQIHSSMKDLFLTKIEKAVHEVLTTSKKYLLDSERMGKLLDNLETREEQNHVRSLIDGRLKAAKIDTINKRKKQMLEAISNYESAISELGVL